MRIVVLVKAVPTVGNERMGADGRVERGALEPNGADEYGLEAALRIAETGDASVTLLSMGPPAAAEALRKGLAMGATDAVLVTDPALGGLDLRGTVTVLAAALRSLAWDVCIAGTDTSDGGAGIVGAALAARLGLPLLAPANAIHPGAGHVRIERTGTAGDEVLEAPTPAVIVGTQLLGDPRYPSLRGIMAARSKAIATRSCADLGLDPATLTPGTRLEATRVPPARAGATVVRPATPAEGAAAIVGFLGERGLR
ncbi:MAG: electron transfer flavoprotein subunit beta/FixA family protein [Chloroflexota bacterium]